MYKVKELSRLTGVSVRTIQYYDNIGLLKPVSHSVSGYRLYDDTSLETLNEILLFRELKFPLKKIIEIVGDPDFDRKAVLSYQIELLSDEKERLEKLIEFACEIREKGVCSMDYSIFDNDKLKKYEELAREKWGDTDAYKEYEKKKTDNQRDLSIGLMKLFVEFGNMKKLSPDDSQVQMQVQKLKDYITDNYYTCTNEILSCLGTMYCAGGEFTDNIDNAGGKGTAEFTANAIKYYCSTKPRTD